MSWRRDLDLLHDEEIDIVLKPHLLSFAKYHLFFIFLIIIIPFLQRLHLLLESDASISSAIRFLGVTLSGLGMNIIDTFFIFSFWIILIIIGWIGKRLLHRRALMLYIISVAASGTILEFYLSIKSLEMPFIQRPYVKLALLAVTAILSMSLVEIHRRKCRYIITNRRIIIREGLTFKEKEITYEEIFRIQVNQGILGRIFNFGTIILFSTTDFRSNESSYKEIPKASKQFNEEIGEEYGLESWRSKNQLLLFGVPNPRRIRVIIGNRQLETRESST